MPDIKHHSLSRKIQCYQRHHLTGRRCLQEERPHPGPPPNHHGGTRHQEFSLGGSGHVGKSSEGVGGDREGAQVTAVLRTREGEGEGRVPVAMVAVPQLTV